MSQVYTAGQGFVYVDPHTSKSLAGITLDNLTENIGIPNTIIYEWGPRTSHSQLRPPEDNKGIQDTWTSKRTILSMEEQS